MTTEQELIKNKLGLLGLAACLKNRVAGTLLVEAMGAEDRIRDGIAAKSFFGRALG